MRGWRPWTVQPPPGTPIDWDNPLTQGLFFCYQGAESHELTTGSRPTLLGTLASPLLVPTGTGLSIDWNATSSMAYTAYQDGPTVNTVTVLCYAQKVGTPVDSAILIGKGYDNTAGDASYGLMWNLNGSQGANSVTTVIMDGGNRKFTASAVAPIALTTPSVLIGTYDQTYLRNFQNGIEYGTPTALTVVPNQYTGAGNSMMVSGYSDAAAGDEWAGNIFMGAVWSRALNPAEIADISANPWQVFHRRRRAYSIVQASGVTVALTGVSAAVSAGKLSPVLSLGLTGSEITVSSGALVPALSLDLTGVSSSVSTGTLTPVTTLSLTGTAAAVSAGFVSPQITIRLSSLTVTVTPGNVSVPGNVVAALTGVSAAVSAGTLSPGISRTLAGNAVSAYAGNLLPSTTIGLTGLASSVRAGTLSPSLSLALSSLAAAVSVGYVTPALALDLTGASVSVSAGFVTVSGASVIYSAATISISANQSTLTLAENQSTIRIFS